MKTIDVRADTEGYREAHSYIGNTLKQKRVARETIAETMLIFESLFYIIQKEAAEDDPLLNIVISEYMDDIRIRIGFEGRMIDLFDYADDDLRPESRILHAYADKIDCSYYSGYNNIKISVRRSYSRYIASGLGGILAAFLVYFPIRQFVSPDGQQQLLDGIIIPVASLFGKGILMIGAPVTFLSLVRNMTDTYMQAERNSRVRKLQLSTISTSVAAIGFAVIIGLLLFVIGGNSLSGFFAGEGVQDIFADSISQLMPEDIFTPFQDISPFPLLIFASMVTYACCLVGKYYKPIRFAFDAAYALFSRMLSMILFMLPLFLFTAVLEALMAAGGAYLGLIVILVIIIFCSLPVILLFYILRLIAAGFRLRDLPSFIKQLIPQLGENFMISSAIDAVPYNVRYCSRNYGLQRSTLEESLPVLAQINLDGNCFIIALIAMTLLSGNPAGVTVMDILWLAALVLFLSLGAPNQPGSCAIGVVVVTTYMHMDGMVTAAIMLEFIFGGLLNLINVMGDIVTVVAMDAREKREERKQTKAAQTDQAD